LCFSAKGEKTQLVSKIENKVSDFQDLFDVFNKNAKSVYEYLRLFDNTNNLSYNNRRQFTCTILSINKTRTAINEGIDDL